MNNELFSKKIPNILIVDDIPDNLKVLGDILKGNGYKVRPVLNGVMALQVAEKEKPDLILLDIMMPDMDGYEVSRKIQENDLLKDIPVIFISALNETNDIVKAFAAGGVDYITKPFKAEEVKARVATHLKLRQQKLKLQELNSEKVKFFSILAHDLRGPLGGLMMLAEMMKDNSLDLTPDQKQELTINLSDSASNIYNLLENLLQWSQLQNGHIKFKPDILNINSIANDCIKILKETYKNKSISINLNIANDLEIIADNIMMQIILRNLLSNAIKFTPHGGEINISAMNKEDNEAIISVSDNGIGMGFELLNNLFKIDSKVSRSGTEGEPSSGLGLLLCKEFVEKQGGKIWVESTEGKGSVFNFTVSINKEQSDKVILNDTENIKEISSSLKNLKILIAEDNKMSQMLLNFAIRKYFKEVINVNNGLEALEAYENHPDLDVIIMDINMPEMDGYEASRKIRELNKNVIIIAQTAFLLSIEKEKAIESGCNDYISKPIDTASLLNLIHKHIKN